MVKKNGSAGVQMTSNRDLYKHICLYRSLLQMSLVLGKLDLMHMRKVSSQIILCSPHMLIRKDTLRFYVTFRFKEVYS